MERSLTAKSNVSAFGARGRARLLQITCRPAPAPGRANAAAEEGAAVATGVRKPKPPKASRRRRLRRGRGGNDNTADDKAQPTDARPYFAVPPWPEWLPPLPRETPTSAVVLLGLWGLELLVCRGHLSTA